MAGADQPAPSGISTAHITGVVLAGGRGARMGGVDKGLQLFDGVPLAQHALRRLQTQVGRTMLNANRHLDRYRSFGVPVWPDEIPDFAGPLAGFCAALRHCETPYLVTVPCDTPLFPDDLVLRLVQGLVDQDGEIAMASTPENGANGLVAWRPQPVFCLLPTGLLPSLERFMQNGGRKVEAWTASHKAATARFDTSAAFANVNTKGELLALQRP